MHFVDCKESIYCVYFNSDWRLIIWPRIHFCQRLLGRPLFPADELVLKSSELLEADVVALEIELLQTRACRVQNAAIRLLRGKVVVTREEEGCRPRGPK